MKLSNKSKYIDIKNHIYCFFDDIINIRNFDPNEIKIDEKSHKNILIYYIGYMTIKDLKYLKINSVNLYTLLSTKNRCFEEINKNKYLTLVPTNKSKEIKKKIWGTVE